MKRKTVVDSAFINKYVDVFNQSDVEHYRNYYPNAAAADFLIENIPRFRCPDAYMERAYYFRWWVYRKHIKRAACGYIVTEFLPDVAWAGPHNGIVMPAPMQIMEGRWLHNREILDDYIAYYFTGEGDSHAYSTWLAHAALERAFVTGDFSRICRMLPDIERDYRVWEQGVPTEDFVRGLTPDGLFYTRDGYDGSEISLGGHGYRPLCNAAMYGVQSAIAKIAEHADDPDTARHYAQKARDLKELVQRRLWNEEKQFFTVRDANTGVLCDARELYGLSPWLFDMPDDGYEAGFAQLRDPGGFFAPHGLTFAEQRHPGFTLAYEGHECQWNGPSWPLATAIALASALRLLRRPAQRAFAPTDFHALMAQYAAAHCRIDELGRSIPWIDENMNPYTGEWLARAILIKNGRGSMERGKDYNHSSFCDLVITGLAGLWPREDRALEVWPMLTPKSWPFFALEGARYRGRMMDIYWDATGEVFGRGKGLSILVDGEMAARRDTLDRFVAEDIF